MQWKRWKTCMQHLCRAMWLMLYNNVCLLAPRHANEMHRRAYWNGIIIGKNYGNAFTYAVYMFRCHNHDTRVHFLAWKKTHRKYYAKCRVGIENVYDQFFSAASYSLVIVLLLLFSSSGPYRHSRYFFFNYVYKSIVSTVFIISSLFT